MFEHGGALNVTLENSRVGNVLDEKGAMLAGSSSTAKTNLVIDNVDFHDIFVSSSDVHNECIMAHAPGITIRNSTFTNCHTMDISLGRGDWWGQPPYGNVTFENNVFGHSTNGSGWHYYGLAWFVGKVENARVVNNSFENQVRMKSIHIGSGPYSGVWATNIGGGWQCLAGLTYRNNIGKKCDASDIAVTPSSSCGPPEHDVVTRQGRRAMCAPARPATVAPNPTGGTPPWPTMRRSTSSAARRSRFPAPSSRCRAGWSPAGAGS